MYSQYVYVRSLAAPNRCLLYTSQGQIRTGPESGKPEKKKVCVANQVRGQRTNRRAKPRYN